MDGSSIGCGGFLCGTSGGILDLEASLHRPRQTQLGHQSHAHEHGMNPMAGTENDHSVLKGLSMNINKGKTISPISYMSHSITSEEDEDEPAFAEDGSGEISRGLNARKASPWHRMKWTDNVVRLLIVVVAHVGDDGTLEGVEGLKRKFGALQKKGKWKAVSKIMISKGCCVSPQQCEDKFNDLNKRYKRLNEILGRGTTCQVVENPGQLDSMSQLSPKVKDDVRKLLNSKHLFYKEMCAYHNGKEIPICHDLNVQGSLPLESYSKDNLYSEGEEVKEHNDSNGSDDDDDDDEELELDNDLLSNSYGNEEDREFGLFSARLDSFEAEMAKVFQDPTKSQWGQKQWIKCQMLRLKEEMARFEEKQFELEKQHFKWLRFRSKKDQELEQLRLVNERMQLENERMLLQLKHKDLKFNSKKIDDPSSTAYLDIQRPLEKAGFL